MKIPTTQTISRLIAIGSLLLFGAGTSAPAADGAWNVDADGNWSTPGNWLGNAIADGPGSTAYFTNALTAVHTVTLDSARTNGNLVFDNANATSFSAGWVLSGSGLTLTNSAATPVITVSNMNALFAGLDATNDVIINSVITSPQGFIKNGPGTLTLSGANVLGGSAQINEGIIALANATALGAATREVRFDGGGVQVWAGGPTFANTNRVLSTCIIVSSNGNYDNYAARFVGSGTVNIRCTGRFTTGGGSGGDSSEFGAFSGTFDLTGSTSSGIWRINLGSSSTVYNMSTHRVNMGTDSGRVQGRLRVPVGTIRFGSLLGGPATQLIGADNNNTLTIWEIGALNESTTFEGRIRDGSAVRPSAFTKVGSGTLTLTANHDYTGLTTISNGVLALTGTATLSGPTNYITVHTGTTFDVSGLTTAFGLGAGQTLGGSGVVTGEVALVSGRIAPGTSTGLGTLSCSNNVSIDGSGLLTTNQFKLASGASDQLRVAGDLTLAGTIALRLVPVGANIPNGTYPLYQWGGTLNGDTNNLVLEYPPQLGTFTLATNLVTKQIVLTVSGVPSANNLVWRGDGAANAWDFATPNWRNGGSASLFNNGDKPTFDDSGSNNVPVDILGSVNPSVVIVNATKPYTIGSTAGAGIIGTISLLKSNTGTLTITADNSYSGGTVIAGGILEVGDGFTASGTLGGGGITNQARLVYNRPDAVTVGPVITGSGSLVQFGAGGTLTLNGANSYTGGTIVSNGTVRLTPYTALGTGPVTLAGGLLEIVSSGSAALGLSNNVNVVSDSTLQYDATGTFAAVVFGALTGNASATLTVNHTPAGPDRLRMYGNFTNNAKLDLTGAGIMWAPYHAAGGQAYNGVISGVGAIVQRGGGVTYLNAQNTYSGTTTNTNGRISFGVDSISSGGSVVSGPLGTGPLALANEAASNGGAGGVQANGGARIIENPILYPLTNSFTFIIDGTDNLTLAGPLTLHGSTDGFGGVNRTIQTDNTGLTTLAGEISDGGLVCGLTKTGTNTLVLAAINTYTGPTTVSNGTLLVNGQIGSGTVSVTGGGTLGGTGIITGPVTFPLPDGSRLAPGNSIGQLTINNSLTLYGTGLIIEVNKSVSPSNDTVVVSGVLTNAGGGALAVLNQGPALVVGDKFKIFNKALQNGGAMTIVGGGAGVNWNNNLAVDGSITVASIGAAQPPLITSTVVSGGNIVISGTNGTAGAPFDVLSSTNLATARAGWTVETSGTFGAGGSFSVSIPVSTITPAKFYLLKLP